VRTAVFGSLPVSRTAVFAVRMAKLIAKPLAKLLAKPMAKLMLTECLRNA
jgi:hypothetical protein